MSSAQERHQAVPLSSDFELDPARMNLLNLADGISREFIHTPDMDSRCAHRPARPHLLFWRASVKNRGLRREESRIPVSRRNRQETAKPKAIKAGQKGLFRSSRK